MGKPYLLCLPLLAAEGRTRGKAGVILAADTGRRSCVGGPYCSTAVALLPVGKAEIAATEIIYFVLHLRQLLIETNLESTTTVIILFLY